jgi:uncharacterized protein YndB with AHSA1/START domain
MIEALRFMLTVDCPPDHAFKTWTERASSWWPRDHTASGERGVTIVFEPRPGGRIFERTVDGREIEWGEVVRWEPPHLLAYRWHIATELNGATDVKNPLSRCRRPDRDRDRARRLGSSPGTGPAVA